MFNLPLPPTGVNHAYSTNKGRWFKVKKLHDWENKCLQYLYDKITPTSGSVCLKIIFYDGDKRKRDIDGRIKSILDLFQKAGLYIDDSLVYHLEVFKNYDKENPRVEIFCSRTGKCDMCQSSL